MDLTFQVPRHYCSLQHWALLLPPDTSTTERHFHFWPSLFILSGAISLLFPSNIGYFLTWGPHLLVSYLFAFSYCSRGSQGKSTGVVCHSLLQWTTFCQSSPLGPVCFEWPCTAWLITSLSCSSPFAATGLWSMKGSCVSAPGQRDRDELKVISVGQMWHKDRESGCFCLFIFGRSGSLMLCTGSLVAAGRGCSSLQHMAFSLQWLPLWRSMGSGAQAQ